MRAIHVVAPGGPEALELVDVEAPTPGTDEVRVRNHAIAVNFIDVYHRTGLYPLTFPTGLGSEAAGAIVAVGENVRELSTGDRPEGRRGGKECRCRWSPYH